MARRQPHRVAVQFFLRSLLIRRADVGMTPTRRSAGAGPVRFAAAKWILAPCTTWRAKRLAAGFGPGMDARTAWIMARLATHPEEIGYAMHSLSRCDPQPSEQHR